jgi:hypothetical protein
MTLSLGVALAQDVSVRSETFVPAGTKLVCTIDEPDFSSKTAQRGDPVLCKTSSAVEMYSRTLIPRGSYLTAKLKDYHDPGHFVGKGWMQLEFVGLTMPSGSVPFDAKVTAAGRYRVSSDGKILGRGHPVRDAIEWAIPVLWPIKVLTLPARGPRPTLKGETRIEVRLMEDLAIPESAYANSVPPAPAPAVSQSGADERGAARLKSRPPIERPMDSTAIESHAKPVSSGGWRPAPPSHYTLLALRNGQVYKVTDYWIDKGNLGYVLDGAVHNVRLDAVDVPTTRRLNTERGVLLTFAAKNR